MQFPYGIADFEKIRRQGYFYRIVPTGFAPWKTWENNSCCCVHAGLARAYGCPPWITTTP